MCFLQAPFANVVETERELECSGQFDKLATRRLKSLSVFISIAFSSFVQRGPIFTRRHPHACSSVSTLSQCLPHLVLNQVETILSGLFLASGWQSNAEEKVDTVTTTQLNRLVNKATQKTHAKPRQE